MIVVGPDFDEQLDAAETPVAYVPRVTRLGERVWYFLDGDRLVPTKARSITGARCMRARRGLREATIAHGPPGITSVDDPELVRVC